MPETTADQSDRHARRRQRRRADRRTRSPLVDVEHLTIRFPIGRAGFWGGTIQFVHAVEDVTLDIQRGETLGLVGESGSGKTTFGRAILRRIDPWSGTIRFDGEDITQRHRRSSCACCAAGCSSCSRIRTPASTRA